VARFLLPLASNRPNHLEVQRERGAERATERQREREERESLKHLELVSHLLSMLSIFIQKIDCSNITIKTCNARYTISTHTVSVSTSPLR